MKSPTAYLSLAILLLASCDGFEREVHRIRGHMAALFTPFHPDGSLDLGEVQTQETRYFVQKFSKNP